MTGDDDTRREIAHRLGISPKVADPSYLAGLEFDAGGNVRVRAGSPRDVVISSRCSQREYEAAFRSAFALGGEVVFRD